MKKRKIIFILGLAVIFIIAGVIFRKEAHYSFQKNRALISAAVFRQKAPFLGEEIVVAACPTFYYMLEKLDNNGGIKTLKTQSTAESLRLLERGEVDLVISGRALKAQEPDFSFKKIGPGYDFIFKEEIFILEKKMSLISFYTDLSPEKIIKDFNYLSEANVIKAENPYQYLSAGIAIVHLEGKAKGEIVHIFKEDGSRVRLSRSPRIYYSFDLPEEKLNLVKKIVQEKI